MSNIVAIARDNQPAVLVVIFIFSCVLRDSTPHFAGPSVHPSISQSVRWSIRHTFWVLMVFGLTASAL